MLRSAGSIGRNRVMPWCRFIFTKPNTSDLFIKLESAERERILTIPKDVNQIKASHFDSQEQNKVKLTLSHIQPKLASILEKGELIDYNELISIISSLKPEFETSRKLMDCLRETKAFNEEETQLFFLLFYQRIRENSNHWTTAILRSKLNHDEKKLKLLKMIHIADQFKKANKDTRLMRISNEVIQFLVDNTDPSGYYDLFTTLMKYETTIISNDIFKPITRHLFKGNKDEQNAYEFHDLIESPTSERRTSFLRMYKLHMIRQIAMKYIDLDDGLTSGAYIELMTQKLENELNNPRLTESHKYKIKDEFYTTLALYTTKFRNIEASLDLLSSIKDYKFSPKFLHIITSSLRKNESENLFLISLNKCINLSDQKLLSNPNLKNVIACELLVFLRKKFSETPKVFIGHFVSIFPSTIDLLNELGLLGLIYHNSIDSIVTEDELFKADVNPLLRSSIEPSMHCMHELYLCVLNYISETKLANQEIYQELFARFHKMVVYHQEKESGIFEKLDTTIMKTLTKRACVDLEGEPDLAITIAKTALKDFKFYQMDTAFIEQILYIVKGLETTKANELLQTLADLDAPLSFRVLCSSIIRLDRVGKTDEASVWYKLLLDMKLPIKHYELMQIIIKNSWELPEDFEKVYLKVAYLNKDERKEIELNKQISEPPVYNEQLEMKLTTILDDVIKKYSNPSSNMDIKKQRDKIAEDTHRSSI